MEVDRSTLGESVIPWVHRRKIGRFRAYWRTCWMAVVHPRKLAVEMTRPANLADALLFRRTVVLQTLLFLLLLAAIGFSAALANGSVDLSLFLSRHDIAGSVFQLLSVPMGLFLVMLWLMLGTGFPSYFFPICEQPQVQQNRAVALSFYSAAPLAFLPITTAIAVAAVAVIVLLTNDRTSIIILGIGFVFAYAPLGLQFLSIIRTPVALLGAVTHRAARQWTLGFTLPLAWFLLGFLLLVLLPVAWLILGVMFVTLLH